jgi:cell division protein FtsQ
MQLPVLLRPLLAGLDEIAARSPEILNVISEIRINRRAYDGFDLIVFPVHNKVRVRLNPELDANLLRYTLLMVDVLSSTNPGIEEIDFRSGTATYTIKEASSE